MPIKVNLYKFIGSCIIFIIIVFLLKVTPFYNYPFDQIKQNTQQIITYSPQSINTSQGLIIIDSENKKNIKIDGGLNYFEFQSQTDQKISFAAREIYSDTFFFIQINEEFLKIFPQSAIYIQNTGNNLYIVIIDGIVQYLDLKNTKNILFKGDIKPLELSKSDSILSIILKNQNYQQKQEIVKIYGGKIIFNKTFDYIIRNLIKILSRISPKKFGDNLYNYNRFRNYIQQIEGNLNIPNELLIEKNEKQNINKDIFDRFKKGSSKIKTSF